jgi:hypothetical protein
MTAQLLAGTPADSVERVVDRLLAVQAQDPRGARLAVRARSCGLAAADVDAALTDRRSVVVGWLNRGTLHLVRNVDYWWLHRLTTPQLVTGTTRRLAQEGVSAEQTDHGVDVIAEQVATHGPRTRAELRTALNEADVPTAGQATVHLLFAASLRGHIVRGPMRGGEQCFVDTTDWLGPPPDRFDRDEALARLARRYLAGHGPANAQDLARWANIGLGDARRGLSALGEETQTDSDGGVRLASAASAGPPPDPLLLGAFDPLLCGWASRDWVVGEHRGLVTTNGVFRPFALVDGRAVATWQLNRGQILIHPLEQFRRTALCRLRDQAHDVLRFLGPPPGDPVYDE